MLSNTKKLTDSFLSFKKNLLDIYEEAEASTITAWVFEDVLKVKRSHLRIADREIKSEEISTLNFVLQRLLKYEPIQYILGYAYFRNYKFEVNAHTLIPRPETEELVNHILSVTSENSTVLDVGTGTGCIAISVKKEFPNAKIFALDVSENALETAKLNAKKYEADVQFIQADFLDETTWNKLPKVDILVSNPPYIPQKELAQMATHVTDFEPHKALFVPDNEPLLFYKKLISFAKMQQQKVCLFAEIHEALGKQTLQLFKENNFNEVELLKDLQGKDRFVKAIKS